MQLSLIDEVPEFTKRFFLDVFAESVFDTSRNRMRLQTISGQKVPCQVRVSCPQLFIKDFPEGTIFKLDARLVRPHQKRPYFVATNRRNIQRAIEFFEYNLKVQHGFDYVPPTRRKASKI